MDVAGPPWAELLARHPRLTVLVLLGSRARGTEHAASDWDVGYLAESEMDHLGLLSEVVAALGTDQVDLVDLTSASAVLRRDAAVEGRLMAERDEGAFADFQIRAVSFWCDVAPVIREAHADVLRAVAG